MGETERTGCPSQEELAAFTVGRIAGPAFDTIAEHLQTCERCTSALAALPNGGDSLMGGLRRSCSDEPLAGEAVYQQAVAKIKLIARGLPPSSWSGSAAPLPIPEVLGRYQILGELGHGGMGTVYLARDTQLRREVALKIPHFRRSDHPRRVERFYREAQAAANIDHPNLCPVYDVGEIDGIAYLSMARIQGEPLSRVLKRGRRFSEQEAAEIVRKIALAVEQAHACGVVHRDIKPSNIMLTDDGEPILTDFGLAQRLELDDPRLTRSGVIVGTPSYMAPEQVDGDPETLGPACDVYSLGVVLYELLTGRVPFEGPLLSVLKQLGHEQPAAPSSHRPDLDHRLEAICLKAIAKSPGDRFPTAAELGKALAGYLIGSPKVVRLRSRRRRLAWLSATGTVALLLALVITAITNRGTLVIKTFDEDVKVSVLKNGQGVEIVDTKTNEKVNLRAGRYELRLVNGKPGLWLNTDKFTLRRGDKVIVEVRARAPLIEDCPVARPPVKSIRPPNVGRSRLFGAPNVVSDTAKAANSVAVADLDDDGDMDVLSASGGDNKIAWHENDGSQRFAEHVISTNARRAFSVLAADVDGDGDLDVLSASANDDKIAWYENDGSQNFTERIISRNADEPRSVRVADLDGDGDLDVLSGSISDNKVAWYENDGTRQGPRNWPEHAISTTASGVPSIFAADLDGDGDVDVLAAAYGDNTVAWYENDGARRGPRNWTEHAISTNCRWVYSVFAADMDGDGDLDVLSASRLDKKIAWHENDGAPGGQGDWKAHLVPTTAEEPNWVFAADLDGDADMDVLSASMPDNKVAWYENDGSHNFTEHTISTTAGWAGTVAAADVDSDGDLDVLATLSKDNKIVWYENLHSTQK